MQHIAEVVGCLSKYSPGFVIEGSTRAEIRHGEVQRIHVDTVFIEIIKTGDPVQSVRRTQQLQFLRKLILV